MIRMLLPILPAVAMCLPMLRAQPASDSVVVLYNARIPDSRKLAEHYQKVRMIPEENLVGLEMPAGPDISRDEYEETILKPLRRQFDVRGWWSRGVDSGGITLPKAGRMHVLVSMKGVPLRIKQSPLPAGETPAPPEKDPFKGHDEASVDSELAMFGIEDLPTEGVLQNKYYKSELPINAARMPFLILTARIDAVSYATCRRMIDDAIETESRGLWGMTYVDIANKFPQGDKWLEAVAKQSIEAGFPTVVDRFNDTFPKNYPMGDVAVYFGWYEWNVNGPFLYPGFRFRKGAVAAHLHSFSAMQMRDASKNWSAALLERGAAVTIGNVWEPYLHLTHDFEILHRRLLAGDTWVEACWKAMPVTSWQGVVLGDPLYRPFLHLDGSGKVVDEDRDYRALRAARLRWPEDGVERRQQLTAAVERTRSPVLAEALALDALADGLTSRASGEFTKVRQLYVRTEDKMRQDFHRIGIDRAAGRKSEAIRALRDAQRLYGPVPAAQSLDAWLKILDPPPPPPNPAAPPGGKKPGQAN